MYSTAAPEGRGSISAGVSSVTRPSYERAGDRAGRLEMRAVATRHHEPLDGPADLRLDPVELVERAVRIVRALDQEHRAGDSLGFGLETPVAEARIEPDVAPAVERRVRIVVMAGHPLAEGPAVIGLARLADGSHRDVLDDHVRREQRDAGHRMVSGVDEGDRAAIAVADEERGGSVELREHLGHDLERLLVEERRGAGERRRVGAPVTEARERDDAPARRSVERPWEAAPEPDRPEPLVQQHERAAVRVALQLGGFEPAPGDDEREGFGVRDGGMLPGARDSRKAHCGPPG